MFDDVPGLDDLGDVRGRSVLVRADMNVPLRAAAAGDSSGPVAVADDFRIRAALPTIHWLVEHGAHVTVASHLGRPHGHPDPALSMAPVRSLLEEMAPGVHLLENLRFQPGEEAGDQSFGATLVDGHDAYVNDAFGTCHRGHASVVYPPTVLPSAAGLLLRRELDMLGRVMQAPAHPFTAVVGGAKVADKLGTIRALAAMADRVVVGGAMALTFLAAQGHRVGQSAVDEAAIDECRALLGPGSRIELPVDLVAVPATGPDHDGLQDPGRVVAGYVPPDWQAFDIGPATRERFARRITSSRTVLWNGPMGRFEDRRFAAGTAAIAAAVAHCTGFTVVGGGDTVRAVDQLGVSDRVTHLSTGGGAMLELIEHGDLPGIAALRAAGRRMATSAPKPPDLSLDPAARHHPVPAAVAVGDGEDRHGGGRP